MHNNTKYRLLLVLSLAIAGCSKDAKTEATVPACPEIERVVFSATMETSAGTKTVLQSDGSIYWSPEDAISILGEKGNYKFTSTLKETAPTSGFITDGAYNGQRDKQYLPSIRTSRRTR